MIPKYVFPYENIPSCNRCCFLSTCLGKFCEINNRQNLGIQRILGYFCILFRCKINYALEHLSNIPKTFFKSSRSSKCVFTGNQFYMAPNLEATVCEKMDGEKKVCYGGGTKVRCWYPMRGAWSRQYSILISRRLYLSLARPESIMYFKPSSLVLLIEDI